MPVGMQVPLAVLILIIKNYKKMKNDFKTFNSLSKGIVEQAKKNLELKVRVNKGIKVVFEDSCYSIYWSDELEQLCGITEDYLWVKASDLVNNTDLLPYYKLAQENKDQALSLVRNLIKYKFGDYYTFNSPFEVTYRSTSNWNGKAVIQAVYYRDDNLYAINMKNSKEFPILAEDYHTIEERIYSQEHGN